MNTEENAFSCINCDMPNLLINAFGIRAMKVAGLPSSVEGRHWDIHAKIVSPASVAKEPETRSESEARYQASIQEILKQRFHLRWHYEDRVQPTYDLVVAKGGAKLTPAAENAMDGASWGNGQMDVNTIPLSGFADMITGEAGRQVFDETGLAGNYAIKLRWSRDEMAAQQAADDGAQAHLPGFVTALQEQLGLKLIPSRRPVLTLVIDSVEIPSED